MRHLKAWLFLLVGFGLFGSAQADDMLMAGHDYAEINPPVSLPASDKITVVELFWYGCPACYRMEPHLEGWLRDKPEQVEFVRIPAIFNNPQWALHAQAYYTAEALDMVEKFHAPFFHAIHRFQRRFGNEEQLAAFFGELGVSAEDFTRTFNSFSVQTKVRQAADLTGRYGIQSVPSLVVEGKYLVNGPMAGSYEKLFDTINILAAREAARVAAR